MANLSGFGLSFPVVGCDWLGCCRVCIWLGHELPESLFSWVVLVLLNHAVRLYLEWLMRRDELSFGFRDLSG